MKQTEFLERMKEIYAGCVETSRRKNTDYCGSDDAFHNFKVSEQLGIPVPQAILVRMSDKMSRVATLLRQEALVADEKITDTLTDLANYAIILRIYLEQQNRPAFTEVILPHQGEVGEDQHTLVQ